MNNVKCQNLVIFFFQNKNETNFHYQETKYNEKIQVLTIFSLLYCLYTRSICILVQFLVEYRDYSNKRHIQRCGAQQRGSAYQREALVSMWIPKGAALIRGNVLIRKLQFTTNFNSRTLEILVFPLLFTLQFSPFSFCVCV